MSNLNLLILYLILSTSKYFRLIFLSFYLHPNISDMFPSHFIFHAMYNLVLFKPHFDHQYNNRDDHHNHQDDHHNYHDDHHIDDDEMTICICI